MKPPVWGVLGVFSVVRAWHSPVESASSSHYGTLGPRVPRVPGASLPLGVRSREGEDDGQGQQGSDACGGRHAGGALPRPGRTGRERRGRGLPERRLRPHRPRRVPAALAQRLLHRPRRLHADRPPAQPRPTLHAAQPRRQADRSHGHEPGRRLQPGESDHHARPGPRRSRGVPAHRRRPHHRHGALRRPRPADRRHRRGHGQAPSCLVGDRQHGDQRGERQPDRAPHGQLPRGPPLHRRAAPPAPRRRIDHPGPVRLPRLPRSPGHRPAGGGGPPAPHGVAVRPARRLEGRPPRPLPRLGLHRGQPAVADRPDAGDSRRRLRRAQGRQSGRPEGGRRLTQVHGRQAHRLPRRQDRPRGRGHGHGALLPQPSRVPARRDVPARRRRQADPDPGQHDRRPLHLPHPALGAGTGPATPGPRSTAMACSAAAARSTRVSSRTWAATTT